MLDKWSCLSDYHSWIVIKDNHAQVWIWDAQYSNNKTTIIPETLLQPQKKNTLHLQQCIDGVEAQYWDDKQRLISSHWWPHKPEPAQLQRFLINIQQLNSSKQAANLNLTVLQAAAIQAQQRWLNRPWAKNQQLNHHWLLKQTFILPAMMLSYAALLFVLVYLSTNILTLHKQEQHLTDAINQLSLQIDDILQVRERAYQYQTKIQNINQLMPRTRQLHLADEIRKLLTKNKTLLIKQWDYQENQLQITLQVGPYPINTMVEELNQSPLFTDISVKQLKDRVQLTIRLSENG